MSKQTSFGAKNKLDESLLIKEKEDGKRILKEKLLCLKVYKKCENLFNELQGG